MRTNEPLPLTELEHATESLKPFQRQTAQTVIDHLYGAESHQRRFLVADEVGLGKTKIARAVVAEAIRRHWDDPDIDRIDIVYICSNQQIARQNLEDLRVLEGVPVNQTGRLTMLPAVLHDLDQGRVNLIAFTPDTSLRFGHAGGRVEERAMLHHLLAQPDVLGSNMRHRTGARRLLVLNAHESFDRQLTWASEVAIPRSFARNFRAVLEREGLIDEILEMTDGRRTLEPSRQWWLVGRLRHALAEACVELLSPDLIILDEFHRFSDILRPDPDEDAQLAQLLFEQTTARVLLLSATPYKMLSAATEEADHFKEFGVAVDFLLGEGGATERVLAPSMRALRAGLLEHRSPEDLAPVRDHIETVLRQIMVRTEKLAATPSRDGMLRPSDAVADVTADDVTTFVRTDEVAQILGNVPSMVEYWKSAPYLFNFMDEYKVKREIDERLGADRKLRKALNGEHMLREEDLGSYRRIDARSPRLRWLLDDLDTHHAFDILWVPPSLPATQLGGKYAEASDFTKRLIFSSWAVVPKAVSALTSYEFERRHHRTEQQYWNRTFSGRLTLDTQTERFTTLALLLPNKRLADIGDPAAVANELGIGLSLDLATLRALVKEKIALALGPVPTHSPGRDRRPNRWYAAAQYLMDDGLSELSAANWVGGERDSRGLQEHLSIVSEMLQTDRSDWGPPPDDLIEVLTDLAIGSPAILLLRALRRVARRYEWQVSDRELRAGAARLAWAFRSLINSSEADHLIMTGAGKGEDFWHAFLRHCIEGGLGSVLDEWFHVLPEQLRLDSNSERPIDRLVEVATAVLTLADGQVGVDFYGTSPQSDSKRFMRTHFAMRFGQARGATAEGENPVTVRNAFNSPFRPFALISTSVGQEGLDFHHYSHAVVHWNLPGNPVDLEQREGRVHRYKGHAVRKNVASTFGQMPQALSGDVWSTVFAMAEAAEDGDDEGGLRPWWVYPGKAAIERYVPILPMSRESGRVHELVEATSLYRMTLGQPRQAELLELLAGLPEEEQEAIRQAIAIDLSPNGRQTEGTTNG